MKNKLPALCPGQIEGIPKNLLRYIGEDMDREGLLETPKRFLKAWEEYTKGYKMDVRQVMKTFKDGASSYNEMVLVKDIPIFSHCEHHLAPFYGVAHIAYIPAGRILGLSKFVRVAEVYARRLQVQERLTTQIADAFDKYLEPMGVAVVLECSHTCMIARGVSVAGSTTITSAMRGIMMNQGPRAEFMGLISK